MHVVNVAQVAGDAAPIAQLAFDFLELHDINSEIHPVSSSEEIDKVILNLAGEVDAGLLVVGAYGQSRLHEFFLGSTTKKMIQESHIPIFMFH